ncbi:SUN domain-containing protein 5-like [Astatotilapia calliptera]|uniref:SUN domain-containing protein 5-like n=1 Tax=Astatotilapia calliptera TaxID=8154 RepID=UPI000E407B5F|nr:SUN domain-containing protein 5-like [Astatotilapia calliptera]
MTEVHPVADTLPNFTSESQGVMILIDVSSWTYLPRENSAKWWLCKFMQWVDPTRAKRRVIQEYLPVPAGNCWPLAGQSGVVIISLFHPVSITALTLGHLPKHQSPDGTNKINWHKSEAMPVSPSL